MEWNYGTFTQDATYIRLAAITLGIGPHSSFCSFWFRGVDRLASRQRQVLGARYCISSHPVIPCFAIQHMVLYHLTIYDHRVVLGISLLSIIDTLIAHYTVHSNYDRPM